MVRRINFEAISLVIIGLAISGAYYGLETILGIRDTQTNIIMATIIVYSVVTQSLINKTRRSQDRLRESERKYRLLAENATDVIWTVDRDLRFTYISPSIKALSGYDVDDLTGKAVGEILSPESRERVLSRFQKMKTGGGHDEARSLSFEYEQVRRDGSTVWMEARATFVYNGDGALETVQGVSRDISRRKAAEDALRRVNENLEETVRRRTVALERSNEQLNGEVTVRRDAETRLRESESRYRSIFENTGAATVIIDREMVITLANSEVERITGYAKPDIEGKKSWLEFIDMNDMEKILRFINRRREKLPDAAKACECNFMDKAGNIRNILISYAAIPDTEESVVSMSDISELKAAEQQIYHQAFHDTLTNLPNRSLFLDHLSMAIKRRKRSEDYHFAVLYLDIDRFKYINDSLGHLVGDQFLISFAQRLQECLRDIDTLARLGGDEFAVLLEDIEGADSAIGIAERIQTALKAPFMVGDREIFTTASLGIVLNTGTYQQAETIIRDADAAMYHAKEKGKARFEIFDPTLHEKALLTLQLETDLRRAVEEDAFELYYQPIVSVKDGGLIGFEALIRWFHPVHGMVYPDVFIPIAEETGLIIPLGKWVLAEACRQMVKWNQFAHDPSRYFISVNISGKQFAHPTIVADIRQILAETGLPPEQLKLEITESVIMEDTSSALEALLQLKSLGAQIVIDDFGTGYSSLSYLQQLPIDTLKVDRSFVMPMRKEITENRQIVEAIISLAHRLGINVIAEGVETDEQRKILSDLKCQLAQGYLFSRPMNRESAGSYLQSPPTFCAIGADGPLTKDEIMEKIQEDQKNGPGPGSTEPGSTEPDSAD